MSGYSNGGFRAEGGGGVGGGRRDVYSRGMEVAAFQADNETFVDDEESYVRLGRELRPPPCRRNLIRPQARRYSYAWPGGERVVVGYHSGGRRAGAAEDLEAAPVFLASPGGSPRKPLDRRDSAVLAPILASVERKQFKVRRSRSTVISSPHRPHHPPQLLNFGLEEYAEVRKSLPSLVAVRHYSPARLEGFDRLGGEIVEPRRTPPKKPNTAVISPNVRGSTAPLLPLTPVTPVKAYPGIRELSPPPRSPSTFSKASWATLPTVHLPTEMLCCVGFSLLLCGVASLTLCFYIMSLAGKKYFIYFGSSAGFTSLVMGVLSFRTNKWKWLPHRNYLTGYTLLAAFSFLNTCFLGGICYALQKTNWPLVDTLGGGVCAMSLLVGVGCLAGLVTSGCCHRPPPDNRVAHRVAGFTV